MSPLPFLCRALALSLASGAVLTAAAQPAAALQEIDLRLPILQTSLYIQLKELTSTSKLFAGNSDLAELDRATNGAVGRKLVELFNALPLQTKAVVNQAVGSPCSPRPCYWSPRSGASMACPPASVAKRSRGRSTPPPPRVRSPC